MTLILFLIVLTLLIFVHELGHFLFAKKFGIRVDEFAIGFPPKIFSWVKGETKYSINMIPFGGFVRIFGENPNEESLNGPDASRSFINKNRWVQSAVLVGGVLFNIIFAWILFSGSLFLGVPATNVENPDKVVITNVLKNSPAEFSGFKVGDEIQNVSVIGRPINTNPDIISSTEIKRVIGESSGKAIEVSIVRNGKNDVIDVLPKEGITSDGFAIGIGMADLSVRKFGFFASFFEGLKLTIETTKATAIGLFHFFVGVFTFKANLDTVSGPVGIVGIVGHAKEFGFGYLLSITALISVNLAVLNLIPFPALDGGRLLFVALEGILRRRISPKIQNIVNATGFLILITLMVVISFADISKLF